MNRDNTLKASRAIVLALFFILPTYSRAAGTSPNQAQPKVPKPEVSEEVEPAKVEPSEPEPTENEGSQAAPAFHGNLSTDADAPDPFASTDSALDAVVDMVVVPAPKPFLIDVFESTWDLNEDVSSKPASLATVEQAEDACKKKGKRLATKEQWLFAATLGGKNKSSTLLGDSLLDAAGRPKANIGNPSHGSLSPYDWARVGIDAVGTVGLTGNRPEWVWDGKEGIQCGGGYEVTDFTELSFEKICSRRGDGRWRRPSGTATPRCVQDFDPNAPIRLTYSASVTKELLDLVQKNNPKVASRPTRSYEALRESCKNPKNLKWMGPIQDTYPKQSYYYPYVTLTDGKTSLEFDCQYFGANRVPESKKPKLQSDSALLLSAITFESWKALKVFSVFSFNTPEVFQAYLDRANNDAALDLFSDSRKKSIEAFLSKNRIQEAIWEADKERDVNPTFSNRLREHLENTMASSEIASKSYFKQNGNVSDTQFVKLKAGIDGLFKTSNRHPENFSSEVATYYLDKLIGLNVVPAAVLRDISGTSGALVYWVHGARTAYECGRSAESHCNAIRILDVWSDNPDRHYYNFLILTDGKEVAIDHNRCCVDSPVGNYRPQPFSKFPSKEVYRRLKELTDAEIDAAITPFVTANALNGVKMRRNKILATFERDCLKVKKSERDCFEVP